MSEFDTRSSHWYTFEGKPNHFVPNKSKPGTQRPATVRDAKDLMLMPSVSGMIGMIEKYSLTQWKIRESIKLAVSMMAGTMGAGLTPDTFADKVMKEPLSDAGTWGTDLHGDLETWMKGEVVVPSPRLPMVQGFQHWARRHKFTPLFYNGHSMVEYSFCNVEGGYAGTYDFKGWVSKSETPCQCGCEIWGALQTEPVYVLADYKTQATKIGQPVRFYTEWGPQLAAYDHGTRHIGPQLHGKITGLSSDLGPMIPWAELEVPKKMSIVVSSTEAGRVESQIWDDEKDDWCWQSFKSLRQLYYSPLGQGSALPWRPVDGL